MWGAQLYALDTALPLRQRGIELTLATPAGTEFADAWRQRGLPLIDLPVRLHNGLRRSDGSDRRPAPATLGRDAAAVVLGVRHVTRAASGFDILHSYALRTHFEVALAGRLRRRPVLLDLVNIVRPGIGRWTLRLNAELATLTIANSRATAEVIGDRKVQVINPGIDLGRFRPGPVVERVRAELCADPRKPLVGIIGRLDARKGVQVLIEAMANLHGPLECAQLVIVGDAGTGPVEFAQQLRVMAHERLGERVRFVGRRGDIPDVIRAVDVVVNASKAEPFGLSVLEAQACGTPVIGTAAGGIPEFVEDGKTGLLVPPFEPVPLAHAIARMLHDRSLADRLAAEALRRVHPARGLEAQYDQLASTYREVLGMTPPAFRTLHGAPSISERGGSAATADV